jgi:hypothetical protein
MTTTDETATTPDVHAVEIRTLGAGRADIIVDGTDLSNQIVGATLDLRPREPAVLVLELSGPSVITDTLFEGHARVMVGEAPLPGPAAAEFLAAIDPETLDKAALNRLDLTSEPHGLTAAMLRQLVEWANGGGDE